MLGHIFRMILGSFRNKMQEEVQDAAPRRPRETGH